MMTESDKGENTRGLTYGCTMHGNARLWMFDVDKRKVLREGEKTCLGYSAI